MEEGNPVLGGPGANSGGNQLPNSGLAPGVSAEQPNNPSAQAIPSTAPIADQNPISAPATPPTAPSVAPTSGSEVHIRDDIQNSSANPPEADFATQFVQQVKSSTENKENGDIILNNNQKPKNNKKIFIIAGIVCLVIAVIAIVAATLVSSNQQNTIQVPKPQASTTNALDQYGEALEKWDQDSTKSTSDLKKLYDNFYQLAQNDPLYSNIQEDLKRYQDLLAFAGKIIPLKEIDYETLLEEYLDTGYEESLEHLQTVFQIATTSEEEQDYVDLALNYYQVALLAFEAYSNSGCFEDDSHLNATCAREAEMADTALSEARSDSYADIDQAESIENNLYEAIRGSYDAIKESVGQNEN